MDVYRLEKLVNLINNSGADVVIFGGDLFHSDTVNSINYESIQNVKTLLKEIKAPLGKFAVYGDQDHNNLDIVNETLFDSDFEVINNNNIKLRNKGSQSINIVGIDRCNESYTETLATLIYISYRSAFNSSNINTLFSNELKFLCLQTAKIINHFNGNNFSDLFSNSSNPITFIPVGEPVISRFIIAAISSFLCISVYLLAPHRPISSPHTPSTTAFMHCNATTCGANLRPQTPSTSTRAVVGKLLG